MTELSLSELFSLARQATRGAGLDWGLADDAAALVVTLHRHALPGAPALWSLLRTPASPPEPRAQHWLPDGAAALCGLRCALYIADSGEIPTQLGPVCAPLLLWPVLATHTLHWEGGQIPAAPCLVTISPTPRVSPPQIQRAHLPDEAYRGLQQLAAQTHVPESALSRRGAGE